MELVNLYQKLFEYDSWGNRESLASLDSAGSALEWPLKVLGHIVGAGRIWLARLEQQNPPSIQPWPTLSRDECSAAIEDLHQRWKARLANLTAGQLDENVVYRNTKGVEFRTPLADVLQHLITHSAYHRGQIAAAVRQAGGKPASTDYVVYVRQRHQN